MVKYAIKSVRRSSDARRNRHVVRPEAREQRRESRETSQDRSLSIIGLSVPLTVVLLLAAKITEPVGRCLLSALVCLSGVPPSRSTTIFRE